MRLCSSDPLCAEHHPGKEGTTLHGASCHACLFASETSCERGNKYLDRTVLVPTVDREQFAFFRDWSRTPPGRLAVDRTPPWTPPYDHRGRPEARRRLPVDVVDGWPRSSRRHDPVEVRRGSPRPCPTPTTGACASASSRTGSRRRRASRPEVAIALRTAACSQRSREARPVGRDGLDGTPQRAVSFRHTEQAILQVLDSARAGLILVSYAVYRSRTSGSGGAGRPAGRADHGHRRDAGQAGGAERVLHAPGPGRGRGGLLDGLLLAEGERKGDAIGKLGILHVKCVVADGRWLFLSSANLTKYAFTINMELGRRRPKKCSRAPSCVECKER